MNRLRNYSIEVNLDGLENDYILTINENPDGFKTSYRLEGNEFAEVSFGSENLEYALERIKAEINEEFGIITSIVEIINEPISKDILNKLLN